MIRRIVGITGITVWFGFIAFVVVLQTKANGSEQLFKNLPAGWKVIESFEVPQDQRQAIGLKLGGKITKLTNTILSIEGQQLQINIIHCSSKNEAMKVYQAELQAHSGRTANVAQKGSTVIEFAKCHDMNLINKARSGLGLEPATLDILAKKLITKTPDDWQVIDSFIVPQEQAVAIGQKLGGRINILSNTIFSTDDRKFQVNIFECTTTQDAEEIYKSILDMKGDPAFCLKLNDYVVEFVGDDIELAKAAPYKLGINLRAEDVIERVEVSEINAKVAKLNINTANLDKVIKIFGEPTEYVWENKTYTKNKLPPTYLASFPNGFSIVMSGGKVTELRHTQAGYIWRGKIQVDDSLEKVLKVIGKPKKMITGQAMPKIASDQVLYKDINGEQGHCYYSNKIKGVRLFFRDYKVTALYVTRNDFSGREESRKEGKEIEDIARELVMLLVKGDYAKVVENFDGTMKTALPAEKLQEAWNTVIAKAGAFIEQQGVRKGKYLQYDIVFVTCKFEKGTLDTKVVFNQEKQISGLFFVPSQAAK